MPMKPKKVCQRVGGGIGGSSFIISIGRRRGRISRRRSDTIY